MSQPSDQALTAEGLSVRFGGIVAVDEVDLRLNAGQLLGLIGPNGAGKTTVVNVLSGFQRATAGRVRLGRRDITGATPRRLARLGVGRTFQAGRLFGGLSVLENVVVAGLGIGLAPHRAVQQGWQLLERMALAGSASLLARELPYGDQRRLGLLRALGARPSFLLLDEPAAGLNEAETDELTAIIRDIRDRDGCGVLVIEHDMRMIMRLCDDVHVVDHGRSLFVGPPAEAQRDPAVIEAYLGRREVDVSDVVN